jgi:hypothetical protein
MDPYRILVTVDLLREPRQSRKTRDLVLNFLDFLANNPFGEGDYQEPDAVGRPVQIKVLGDCALTFWTDHAVKEIKVVKVEKADRF